MTRDLQFQARLRAWNALPPVTVRSSPACGSTHWITTKARRHGCTAQDVEQVIVRVLVALMEAEDDAPP